MTEIEDVARAFARAHDWRRQRGPNDVAGAERDRETLEAVQAARTWDDLADVTPPGRWSRLAANRGEE